MNKEQIEKLLDDAVAAYFAEQDAREASKKFAEQNKEPIMPDVFENAEQYLAFKEAYALWYKERQHLDVAERAARSNLKEAERAFMTYLTTKVWFHHGAWAVGIAYSDWGGNNYYLEVVPWPEAGASDLATLDRKYRGD